MYLVSDSMNQLFYLQEGRWPYQMHDAKKVEASVSASISAPQDVQKLIHTYLGLSGDIKPLVPCREDEPTHLVKRVCGIREIDGARVHCQQITTAAQSRGSWSSRRASRPRLSTGKLQTLRRLNISGFPRASRCRRGGGMACMSRLIHSPRDVRTTTPASVEYIQDKRVSSLSPFKRRFFRPSMSFVRSTTFVDYIWFAKPWSCEFGYQACKSCIMFPSKTRPLQISQRYGILHVDAKTAVNGVFESLGKSLPPPASPEEKAPPPAKGKKAKDAKKGILPG